MYTHIWAGLSPTQCADYQGSERISEWKAVCLTAGGVGACHDLIGASVRSHFSPPIWTWSSFPKIPIENLQFSMGANNQTESSSGWDLIAANMYGTHSIGPFSRPNVPNAVLQWPIWSRCVVIFIEPEYSSQRLVGVRWVAGASSTTTRYWKFAYFNCGAVKFAPVTGGVGHATQGYPFMREASMNIHTVTGSWVLRHRVQPRAEQTTLVQRNLDHKKPHPPLGLRYPWEAWPTAFLPERERSQATFMVRKVL